MTRHHTFRTGCFCLSMLACGVWAGVPAAIAHQQHSEPDVQTTDENVETLTEAENIVEEAEQAPQQTQGLPPAAERQRPSRQPTARQGRARPSTSERIPARALGFEFGGESDGGLAIGQVRAGGAAHYIGLQSGDRVVSVGKQRITDSTNFGKALEQALSEGPRDDHVRVPMVVRRGGQTQTVYWTNAALAMAGFGPLLVEYGYYVPPQYVTGYRGAVQAPYVPTRPQSGYLGVELDTQYPGAAIVSKVVPGSAAEQAGLEPGDRIWGVNNQRIDSPNDLIFFVGQMQPGQEVEIHFSRPQSTRVTLGQRGAARAADADPPADAQERSPSAPELPAPGKPAADQDDGTGA